MFLGLKTDTTDMPIRIPNHKVVTKSYETIEINIFFSLGLYQKLRHPIAIICQGPIVLIITSESPGL